VLGSRERHHSACRVASLCEHWELHNTSVCHHVSLHICDFSMDVKLEQRANIKFCVKLGKSGAETFEMIRHAYRNEAMSRARCFEWHARFKRGRTSLEDDERSGRTSRRPTPKTVETIRRRVHEDRRRTIKDIATIVNVSYGTVQTILTCDLNTHHVAANFVPRLLTPEQKEHRVAICQELRQRAVDDPSFMSRVITGDESWVYGYDPETKQQSSQWKSPGSPRPKKARQSRRATKSMLIVFFDIRGIVNHEFVPEYQTVNAEFYCNVLRRLREDIRRKRPELCCAGNWLLHDDNAPSHRDLVTREFLAHKGIITLPNPPYSPDLAPCDFFLFPKMKLQLKGRRFDRVEEMQRESQNVLGALREQDFQHAFQQWQRRWDRCVAAQGYYFEGDAAQT